MKNLPYYRWYPADAATDGLWSSLTDSELGLFKRLLDYSWINEGIPSDLSELARVLRRTPSSLKRDWPRVSRGWRSVPNHPEMLINPRQEIERQYAQAKSRQATDAVRSRPARKSEPHTDVGTDVGTDDLPRAYDSVSDSSVVINSSSPKRACAEVALVSHFHEFWAVYREIRGVGEDQAARVWISCDCDSQVEQIVPCIASYAASRDAQNGAVKNGERWLAENSRDHWRARWPPARLSGSSKTDETNAAIDKALRREASRANQS